MKDLKIPIFDNIATDPTIFGAGLFTFTLPTSSSMQMLKSHIGTGVMAANDTTVLCRSGPMNWKYLFK